MDSILDMKEIARVKYPPRLRTQVEAAVQSWISFCELSQEIKNQFALGDRIRDIGYVLRNDTGPNADKKEFFHIARSTLPVIRERAVDIADLSAIEFFERAHDLVDSISEIVIPFSARIQERYGIPEFVHDVNDARNEWTFRFLHYFGGTTAGKVLAHPHVDRGGFTPHLFESDTGLEYLDKTGQWKHMPIAEGETVIIPGMLLQHKSRCNLHAVCHRVIATEKTAREGRYSMVCFVDMRHERRFNDSKYRSQNFKPGFNYRLSLNEFDELFESR